MQSTNNFRFRTISVIVLAFYLWTFGGIFELAYAFKTSSDKAQRMELGKQKEQGPGERLNKAIEDIEQIIQAVETVRTVEEKRAGKERLKTKELEIEALDKEIRKQFSETETKIKDLPEAIKQRHRDFVKKYEENLKELKNNLEAIKKHDIGSREFDEAVKKTKAHLEKVKPRKKHIPLDPNKLPHRTAEPTKKKPRLRPEQFSIEHSTEGIAQRHEPILVASNGSLNGLLSRNPELATMNLYELSDISSQFLPASTTNSEQTTSNTFDKLSAGLLLAAADPPTDADLAETIEVQFTEAIRAKAEELENKPVKIYNWVRNNIEFVPTYGSIQGADMCLQTKQCNDFDTASLLIALLRVSGIHARYIEGTVEIPIEKVMNWAGGFTDANAAIDFIASGGVPVATDTSGGKIEKAQMEHMWVEAWIDYIPSRGARHRNGQGDTWIRLDASFKQYNYTEGMDIKTAVPFDAESFIEQITATATINEEEGYVTGVDSLFISQTMEDYQTQVENYITDNYPEATVGDVLGKKEIIKQEFRYLLGTLPYRVVVTGQKSAEMADSLRHRIRFKLMKDTYDDFSDTFMDITKNLPEIAGKKITLSYAPATEADEAIINLYLPEPNEDGTPIDPSELPTTLPAYIINVIPELRVDGEVIAKGTVVGLGVTESFRMTFSAPNEPPDVLSSVITAGEYYAIAIDTGRISEAQMTELKSKLEDTKAKLEAQDFTGLTKDDIVGDLLYTTVLSYFAEFDVMDYVTAKTMGVSLTKLPSTGRFFMGLNVTWLFEVPLNVSAGGLMMDIGLIKTVPIALDGDNNRKLQFMLSSGMNSSALEHSVPEQLFSTPENPAEGISAVKALQIANDQGIPIYTVNQTNIDAILPQLQVDYDVKVDIQNAVNAGMVATVSKTNISFTGWTGAGYIIINPDTGAGAYMISGGLRGGLLIGSVFLLIAGLFLSLSILLFPIGLVALPVFIALLTLFYVNVLISLVFLYGVDTARNFGHCMWGNAGAGSTVLQQVSRIKELLSQIVSIVLVIRNIISFGECIADELY